MSCLPRWWLLWRGAVQSDTAAEQADEAVDRPRSGPTGHGGGALRVLALRRAPGARSLSAVFAGHALPMTAPRWPAIIRYSSEPELVPVSGEREWQQDCDLSCWPYEAGAHLIDCDGRVFELQYSGEAGGPGAVSIVATERSASAVDVAEAVRAHLCASSRSLSEFDRGRSQLAGVA